MPTLSKRLDVFAGWGFPQYLTLMLVISISLFSIVIVTSMEILQWWEAVTIVGVLAVLFISLLWSIDKVKRLNS